jgi:hypothetical protein
VYVGKYEISGKSARLLGEEILTQDEFLTAAREWNLVTPDYSLAETARSAGLSVSLLEAMHAGALVPVGWRKIQAGETVLPEQLEANYMRRSDAEIFSKRS